MDKNTIEKIFKPLNNYWTSLDKNKKIRYTVLATAALITIITSVLLFSRTEYTVLYSNLEAQEAGEVLNKLTEMKIDAKAEGSGTILIPKGNEAEIRMKLSAEGYPKSGLNYDLFKNSTGFGTTDFEKHKYMQFQLQERMQNAIKSLDIVEDAIVTLHIPDQSSFVLQSDKEDASASVILKIKNKNKITREQIKGIEGLITKSVPGLTSDQVFIIDSMGNNLNKSVENETELAATQLELENQVSEKYKEQIESMLEPVFGIGRVIAGVRVSLDFDKRTTETTRFDPIEGRSDGIPVSVNETRERASNGQQAGVPGQDPNGGAPIYPEVNTGNGSYERTDKTVNYEINQIKDMLQKAEGNIKDISVSVILDSTGLPADSVEKVKEIVAAATGIDESKVSVQSMTFSSRTDINDLFEDVKHTNELLKRQAYLRNGIIYGILGIILLIAGFILLLKRKGRDDDLQHGFDYIISTDDSLAEEAQNEPLNFDVRKSEKREYIEKCIEKDPEFVAQLLRNWLEEDRRR